MAFNQEHTFTKYVCKPQVAKSEPVSTHDQLQNRHLIKIINKEEMH